MNDLIEALAEFRSKRVLVAGDVMLDTYLFGTVERISPEAPVPLLNVRKKTYALGGAANVAYNLVSLGAKVKLFGVCNDNDEAGRILLRMVDSEPNLDNCIEIDRTRKTTLKCRLIADEGHHHVARYDEEIRHEIDLDIQKLMSYRIIKLLSDVDCVVLADYSKGFYTEYLAQSIIANAKDNGKMVFVDPKPANIRYFTGCSVVRPNLKEAVEITGIKCKNEDTDLERIVKKLGDIVRSPYSLVSWKGGVIVYDSPSAMCKKIMTKTRDVVDVTGAGDTMIAALSLGMVSGLDINGAAELANHAAGIVVGKAGTATTTVDEVRIAIGKNGY